MRSRSSLLGTAGALSMVISACSSPAPATPHVRVSAHAPDCAPITPNPGEVPQASVPAKYLGWHQSQRCIHDFSPIEEPIWFRIASDHVGILYADGDAERFDTRLTATKQDEWDVLTGKYEVGKALWMVDGFVIVDGPLVSPRRRQRVAGSADLKTLYRRITFTEQPGGMIVSIVPSSSTGAHSRLGRLECKLLQVPEDHHAEYDALFLRATGPLACEQATACCKAIRSAGRGKDDEEADDVCDAHPELTAPYCRRWLASAVNQFRTGIEWSCVKQRNGEQICSIEKPPPKPRAVPAACVLPEKPEAPGKATP